MGWPSKLTDRELKRDSLLMSYCLLFIVYCLLFIVYFLFFRLKKV